ncbi:MAG: aspartyl protease family protein [Planctomycetota bacterium]|nr:aspartyl protease family protein [Planctomycetota bacterium]
MGLVYEEIEIINGGDIVRAENGDIGEDQVRRMSVTVLVDTGCGMLAINDTIRKQLGLRTRETRNMQMADDTTVSLDVVGPVELRFENRRSSLDAVVLPGDTEPLLGAIPMQDMDVLVDPQRHRLIVNPNHPIVAGGLLKEAARPRSKAASSQGTQKYQSDVRFAARAAD